MTSRICIAVTAATSAPGFRRTGSSTAVQDVRPVSSAATPSTASRGPSDACPHPGRRCDKRPVQRTCWRPAAATARHSQPALADHPPPSVTAPRPRHDATLRHRSVPGSVRRAEPRDHDGALAPARDQPASAPARPCTTARRTTRTTRRPARSDTRTAPTGSVTLPRTHPAGRLDVPDSRPRPSR